MSGRWLRFVKYPTDAHRDNAARFTAWAFAFGGVVVGYLLLTLD